MRRPVCATNAAHLCALRRNDFHPADPRHTGMQPTQNPTTPFARQSNKPAEDQAGLMGCLPRISLGDARLDRAEIPILAIADKRLGDRFQILPPATDRLGLVLRDLVVGCRRGDDPKHVGKFLHDAVGIGNQLEGMRVVLGIRDEESAGALAHPLRDARVVGDAQQLLDAIQRIVGAAAGLVLRRLGPLVDQREGQAHVRRDLFGAGFLQHLLEQLM